MEAARSLLRTSPAPSPVRVDRRRNSGHLLDLSSNSEPAAMWASPSAARARSRPSNLHAAVRASPSFALSRRDAVAGSGSATPLRMAMQRGARATVQSRTTQATQTEREESGARSGAEICLGAFGAVGEMTAETVDFLIRVLEDRKQELLVSGEERELRVRASHADVEDEDDVEAEGQISPASEVVRLQLDSANSGRGVTRLVRSHSYEALVQLEGILEARHHKLMNNGILETGTNDR